jgi:hypothetical protein
MKKYISCLLVVMMLASITVAFAESPAEESIDDADIIGRFLSETDMKTQAISMQYQFGDEATDLVICTDGSNTHLIRRDNGVEKNHVQLNPEGIYLSAGGEVTLLRYATVAAATNSIEEDVNAMIEQFLQGIPKEQLPSSAEIQDAFNKLAKMAADVKTQQQGDVAAMTSAALSFVSKFKPEYILDVKSDDSSVEVSLRSEAYASALAEAVDEMMSNPALAYMVNRSAPAYVGASFAEIQKEWITNREDILEAIRSTQSTEYIDEDGHYVSHFQIGEEKSGENVLMYDTDAWIDAEENTLEITAAIRFKDEDPIMMHELEVTPDYYGERMSSGTSSSEVQMYLEENRLSGAQVLTVIEGDEELRAYFEPDYTFIRGPEGAVSITEHETWTGKYRVETVIESADGEEARIVNDFYQDDDNSLVWEMYSTGDDDPAVFRLSRINKGNVEDLSASKNITERFFRQEPLFEYNLIWDTMYSRNA